MSRPTKTTAEGGHGRKMSNTAPFRSEFRDQEHVKSTLTPQVHFTALIRLPFTRGDFVDPPQVEWDAAKDRALWKVISRSSKTSDLDWDELAAKFEVSPAFMLQQAAWLYERHLSHVRAQMKKVGSSNATATTSTSGSSHTAVGGVAMKRLGSGGSGASRTPSALSIRPRDSPIPRGENSSPGTPRPLAPMLSRSPSTNTITQSRANIGPTSNRAPLQSSFRSAAPVTSKQTRPTPLPIQTETGDHDSAPDSPRSSALSSSSDSSSSESDTNHPVRHSQIFKRPPRFNRAQKPRGLATLDDDDDEGDGDEDSNTFLPFAQASRANVSESTARTRQDPSATLRDTSPAPPAAKAKYTSQEARKAPPPTVESSKKKGKQREPEITSSATSSASDAPRPSGIGPGPLSPRHRAELARLSPRRTGSRKGSEGTPSMGSSFSDLDDASITQSALEEALLSNMQHGRMSTLSNLRSRYL